MNLCNIIKLLPVLIGAVLIAPLATKAAGNPPMVAVSAAPAEARPTLEQAEKLLADGHAAEAYALLSPREIDWSGAPQFDYLLGVAALDSGHADEAVFSLERVLAAQPDFDGARMELARAQFELGDFEAARAQFRYLESRSPPPATGRVIGQYLTAIDTRAGARQQRWSAFLESGAGYDSNANGSTSDAQFLGLTLDPKNVETDSSFFTLAGGIDHSAGFSNGLASASSLRLDYRNNPDAHFVDQAVASAGTALYWNTGAWRASGGVNGFYGWLDGSPHESYVGLNLGLGRLIADSWELGARLQGGPLRYQEDALEVMDVNRFLGSLTLTRYNLGATGGRIAVSFIAGQDDARQSDSAYDNDKLGGRLSGFWPISESSSLYLDAGYLQTDYANSPGFFGTDRQDDQYTAAFGADIDRWPGEYWTLSPHIRYVRNESNVPLYDYDRWEAGVNLRRSFR